MTGSPEGPEEDHSFRLRGSVESFEQDPAGARTAMRRLFSAEPAAFCAAALCVLEAMEGAPGCRHLCTLLASSEAFPEVLSSSSALNFDEAVRLARIVSRGEPRRPTP